MVRPRTDGSQQRQGVSIFYNHNPSVCWYILVHKAKCLSGNQAYYKASTCLNTLLEDFKAQLLSREGVGGLLQFELGDGREIISAALLCYLQMRKRSEF